ncbi:MAG: lipoyl(octanoyl) transferase LipB [Clostridiaceae bacterium]|nr:lipoyl(octanoyl) transferase LipB [Clostridiaceae bacterium]
MKKVVFMDLGRMRYEKTLNIQKELSQYIKEDKGLAGFFIIVEHNPVLTIGKEGGFENLLCTEATIKGKGIDIHEINRGGNVTYHGPGQIVGYPILDLTNLKKDLQWYVDSIEEVIIKTLRKIGITGGRKEKHRGVWIMNNKICAVGISVKKWVTMHGFALNYNTDLTHFKLINPCGIAEFGVTSIEAIKKDIKKEAVIEELKSSFQEIFHCSLIDDKAREVAYKND